MTTTTSADPISSSNVPDVGALRRRLDAVGQGHLLAFHDSLDVAAQTALRAQIASLDLESLPALIDRYVLNKPAAALPDRIEPAPCYPLRAQSGLPAWDRAHYRARGEALLRAGKIAAFTVAGGQGTRLGFDGPKGTFPGGAVSGKPLFACLADWILAAQDRWQRPVPWYIMTSPLNDAATRAFFAQHRFFGLSERDVMFFAQGVMPSFDMATGKVLLAAPGEAATNPDGHGGSLRALWNSGAINDMRRRGIEHISYVQIDNPLARVIDPVFIGLHAFAPDSSGEMSSKMVAKTDPGEKVGVFCKADGAGGKLQVIEYSDMPRALSERRTPDGGIAFNAGSIAIHMIGVEFVASLNRGGAFGLPYHRAEKKVPYVDPRTGGVVNPASPNAVKLETFVFDAIPLCRASIVMETDRIDEFAPIKNAEGNDSPATCSAIQTLRAARWLQERGIAVAKRADGAPDCTLEVSPRTAMEAGELDPARLPRSIAPGQSLCL